MSEDRGDRNRRPRGRKPRRKVCRFCVDKVAHIDYKDTGRLSAFTSERGKILPRRMTGACAKHQRQLGVAIKRARTVALLPNTKHNAKLPPPPEREFLVRGGFLCRYTPVIARRAISFFITSACTAMEVSGPITSDMASA